MMKRILYLKPNFTLIKTFSVFTFANLLNAAIPFLLLPILTRWLSKTDFGIIAMFQVLITVLIPIVGLNSDSAIVRYYYDRDKIDYKLFVSNSVFMVILSAIVFMPLIIFWDNEIIELFFSDSGNEINSYWLFLIVALVVGQNIFQIQQNLLQAQSKALEFGIYRISKTILEFVLSVFLLYMIISDWTGRVFGQIIPAVLFAFFAVYLLKRDNWFVFKIDIKSIKLNLMYGLPLLPHVLSGIVLTFSDRIFISNMIGIEETGSYSVGYQIGMGIHLIQNSFNQAWVPWFFEQLKSGTEIIKKRLVKITYLYFLFMLLLVVVLLIVTPLIFRFLIGDDFNDGMKYVLWIALGFAFNGMYKMVVNYIFYIKRTYIIGIVTVFTALINLWLNYILITKNGAIGAAQATAIAFFIEFVLMFILSSYLFKMPWFGFFKNSVVN